MRAALFGLALSVLFAAVPAYAQLTVPTFGANLSISLSPQYPAPGDTVQLTAVANGFDITSSAIVWHANGKVIAQGTGAATAQVVAGALGSQTSVEADVETADGSVYSAQATIAPAEVDLLMESDSYVPPFYEGRALPSAGTNLVLQAQARLEEPDGSMLPDSNIVYTWKRNNEVLGDVSGLGASSAVIAAPHLFSTDTISVDARSTDGSLEAATSISVPSITPVLTLYEDHPLYGILYNEALGGTTFIPESEMTFAAVPYFAEIQNPDDPRLSYSWTVDGSAVVPSASKPSEITINADNSTGQADIALEVVHATNFYMDATGHWSITFSSGGPSVNPFQPSAQ